MPSKANYSLSSVLRRLGEGVLSEKDKKEKKEELEMLESYFDESVYKSTSGTTENDRNSAKPYTVDMVVILNTVYAQYKAWGGNNKDDFEQFWADRIDGSKCKRLSLNQCQCVPGFRHIWQKKASRILTVLKNSDESSG
eukprot:g2088.t1